MSHRYKTWGEVTSLFDNNNLGIYLGVMFPNGETSIHKHVRHQTISVMSGELMLVTYGAGNIPPGDGAYKVLAEGDSCAVEANTWHMLYHHGDSTTTTRFLEVYTHQDGFKYADLDITRWEAQV